MKMTSPIIIMSQIHNLQQCRQFNNFFVALCFIFRNIDSRREQISQRAENDRHPSMTDGGKGSLVTREICSFNTKKLEITRMTLYFQFSHS